MFFVEFFWKKLVVGKEPCHVLKKKLKRKKRSEISFRVSRSCTTSTVFGIVVGII
jgi:hypothetical protein